MAYVGQSSPPVGLNENDFSVDETKVLDFLRAQGASVTTDEASKALWPNLYADPGRDATGKSGKTRAKLLFRNNLRRLVREGFVVRDAKSTYRAAGGGKTWSGVSREKVRELSRGIPGSTLDRQIVIAAFFLRTAEEIERVTDAHLGFVRRRLAWLGDRSASYSPVVAQAWASKVRTRGSLV